MIALVRGGGSRADLAAFDGDAVARAIAACWVPVVTGIGHEIDTSVADAVAARSSKTPTACAAGLVDDVRAYLRRVQTAAARVADASRAHTRADARVLEALAEQTRRATGAGLDLGAARIDEAQGRLVRRAGRTPGQATEALAQRAASLRAETRRRLATAGGELDDHARGVPRAGQAALDRAGSRVDRSASHLAAASGRVAPTAARLLDAAEERVRLLDPATILARGYSLTRTGAGRLVRDPHDVEAGEPLRTTLAGGVVHSVVVAAPDPVPPDPPAAAAEPESVSSTAPPNASPTASPDASPTER